jgi:hypothetical protein
MFEMWRDGRKSYFEFNLNYKFENLKTELEKQYNSKSAKKEKKIIYIYFENLILNFLFLWKNG